MLKLSTIFCSASVITGDVTLVSLTGCSSKLSLVPKNLKYVIVIADIINILNNIQAIIIDVLLTFFVF